jgi:hypothetical protein
MKHREIRMNLYEFARGELAPELVQEIEAHLAHCGRCRRESEMLKSTFAIFPPSPSRASSERTDAYWRAFPLRVEERITHEPPKVSIAEALRGLLAAVRQSQWRPAAAFGGATALIALAFGLWSMLRAPESGPVVYGLRPPAMTASSKQAVEDYLRSSRMLLIGISNMSPEKGEPMDLGVERGAARSLVRQARLLSEAPLDERSHELIQDLERILIELANLEERADVPEVEMIRTGMRQQNLLFKIRMAENQLSR